MKARRPSTRPVAVIFDMDGLMLDTESLGPRTWRDAAAAIGVDFDLGHLIASESPVEVAVEKVFVNINPNSTLLLGQARGAAIAAAVLAGLPVHEYTAGQVKQAVVGKGRAAKTQVQEMVRRLLQLSGTPSPDAADALACAICHAHGSVGAGLLRGAGGSMRRGRVAR